MHSPRLRSFLGSTGLILLGSLGCATPPPASEGAEAESTDNGDGDGDETTSDSGESTSDSGESTGDGDGDGDGDGGPKFDLEVQDAAPPCPAPEMLILLDRSMGMGRDVQGQWPIGNWDTSKLWVAIETTQSIVSTYDQEVRFGLGLFPGDAGQDICSPIDDPCWQSGSQDTCKTGNQWLCNEPLAEMAIDFGLGKSSEFDLLDPLTLPVCFGTPTAAGVELAVDQLGMLADGEHQQAVILITDGSAHCGDVIATVQALAANTDIQLYVIGYTDDVMAAWVALLNDAACAAQTAIGFPVGCVMDMNGGWVAEDPNGPPLFYPVANPTQFEQALAEITTGLDCVVG